MRAGRNSDLVWLNHIAECIAEIEAYTEQEKARFEGSRLVQRAVERVLQTLAESTQRLSKEIKAPTEEVLINARQQILRVRLGHPSH